MKPIEQLTKAEARREGRYNEYLAKFGPKIPFDNKIKQSISLFNFSWAEKEKPLTKLAALWMWMFISASWMVVSTWFLLALGFKVDSFITGFVTFLGCFFPTFLGIPIMQTFILLLNRITKNNILLMIITSAAIIGIIVLVYLQRQWILGG